MLQEDGRRTNRDMAQELGIAPSTCLERIRSLRRSGIQTGFHAEANLAAIGRGLQTVIAVRVRLPTCAVIEAFQTFLEGMPEVIPIFVPTYGRRWSTGTCARRSSVRHDTGVRTKPAAPPCTHGAHQRSPSRVWPPVAAAALETRGPSKRVRSGS
jgi:hypothetical protein